MRSLAIAIAVLIVATQATLRKRAVLKSNMPTYPEPAAAPVSMRTLRKREPAIRPRDNFTQFVERTLTRQYRMLERVVKTLDDNEEAVKKLIQHLDKVLERPKLPPKFEPQLQQLQETNLENDYQVLTNPLLRAGEHIPKYGRLIKHLIINQFETETDPTPLIEKNVVYRNPLPSFSRRSLSGDPGVDPDQENKDEPSLWCDLASHCNKTEEVVCGFDDNFGFGKFNDMCHMLHVNCFYRFNFTMVYTCNPKLK